MARPVDTVAGRSRLNGRAPRPAAAAAYSQAGLALDSGRFLRLNVAGTTVAAVSGMLWLTRDGCWDDTLLEAGQQYRLPDDTPVLVGAFGPSVARLVLPTRRSGGWPLVSWLPAIARRLARLRIQRPVHSAGSG